MATSVFILRVVSRALLRLYILGSVGDNAFRSVVFILRALALIRKTTRKRERNRKSCGQALSYQPTRKTIARMIDWEAFGFDSEIG